MLPPVASSDSADPADRRYWPIASVASREDQRPLAQAQPGSAALRGLSARPKPDCAEMMSETLGALFPRGVDHSSPQFERTADRLAALSAAAPAVVQLAYTGDWSAERSNAFSERLLDKILALDEPKQRFTALSLLLSKEGNAFDPSELLDARAVIRILDAASAFESPQQLVLVEMVLPRPDEGIFPPVGLGRREPSEHKLVIDRIFTFLSGMNVQDQAAPLARLISSNPMRAAKPEDRWPIAQAMADAVFAQGPEQLPWQFKEFVSQLVYFFPSGFRPELTTKMTEFLGDCPREFQRKHARVLLSARYLVPGYTHEMLERMARDDN